MCLPFVVSYKHKSELRISPPLTDDRWQMNLTLTMAFDYDYDDDDSDDYGYDYGYYCWFFVKGQADPAPTMIEFWTLKPETLNLEFSDSLITDDAEHADDTDFFLLLALCHADHTSIKKSNKIFDEHSE